MMFHVLVEVTFWIFVVDNFLEFRLMWEKSCGKKSY